MKLKKQQIEKLLDRMTILIDTNEKDYSHIIDVLEVCKKDFEFTKLNFGDYSFRLNHSLPNLLIDFSHKISIERKANLDELIKNLTTGRKRFENELERSKTSAASLTLMLENATYEDILRGNYQSKFPSKSFFASILTYQARYNLDVMFINSICSANYIYNRFRYYLRDYLKDVDIWYLTRN